MKIIPLLLVALMAISVSALAVEEEQPKILIKPCSFFYPVKLAFEGVKTSFLSDEGELLYRADLANERMEDIKQSDKCNLEEIQSIEDEREEHLTYIDLLLDMKIKSLSNKTRDELEVKIKKNKQLETELPNATISIMKINITEHPLGLLRAIQVHEIAKQRFTERIESGGVALKAKSVSALDKLKIRLGLSEAEVVE